MKFQDLVVRAKESLSSCQNLHDLDAWYRQYLGKKGEFTKLFDLLKEMPPDKRPSFGQSLNEAKRELVALFEKRKEEFTRKAKEEILKKEWLDVTAPGKKIPKGHLHPLTLVARQVREIFQQMGFSVVLGPEIEDEWHNFDALNIPQDHPARDLWDTLWLKESQSAKRESRIAKRKAQSTNDLRHAISDKRLATSDKLLLRTHTSPVQIRYMEKHNPPLRIIAPGRVFRHEATDASHEINFYQVEGLMVDKDVSVANFKAIIQQFFQRFFGSLPKELPGAGKIKGVEIRLRPSYFPFVEPGFEVDVSCTTCSFNETDAKPLVIQGKTIAEQTRNNKCSVCQGTGWLEMMGAGMVHPKVFEAVRLNPREWQGFAFGMGLDRLAMMKYKINDIRLFYSGDLRFLQQF